MPFRDALRGADGVVDRFLCRGEHLPGDMLRRRVVGGHPGGGSGEGAEPGQTRNQAPDLPVQVVAVPGQRVA